MNVDHLAAPNKAFYGENSNIHVNRSDNYSYPYHVQTITIITEVQAPKQ